MQPLPRHLIGRARDRHGLLTTADLAGTATKRQRNTMLSTGQLVVVHRGVYRLATHAPTLDQRCLAACLAAPGAAISGPTAGRLLGLRRVQTDDIHIIAGYAIELVGVVAHRTTLLRDADVETRGDLRILRPARLVCDLARFLDDHDLESVIEQVLERRLASIGTIRVLARSFITSGRDGSRRLARVLDGRPIWRRPVGSDLELRLLRELRERGLAVETQVPVVLDDTTRLLIDLAIPALRFGIEVDHVAWHGGRLDTQRDKARDRGLLRLGWRIARVTDSDIEHRLAPIADELAAIAGSLSAAA